MRDQRGARTKRPAKQRILVDENISGTESMLRSQYHLAVTVARVGDTDEANIERARAEGLIFVTPDNGDPRRLRIEKSPGIVLLSGPLQQDTASAAALIGTFFTGYSSAGFASGTPLPQERLRLRWEGGDVAGVLESLTAASQPVVVPFRFPAGKRRNRR